MRYLIMFQLCFMAFTVEAQVMSKVINNDLQVENKQLSHKFRMASYLLSDSSIRNRTMSSSNDKAKNIFILAEANFELVRKKINLEKWMEANAIIDSVLRDLTHVSQILNQKNIKRNEYIENVKRVDSFVLPKWKLLSTDEKEYLMIKNKEISRLMGQASGLEMNHEYARANVILDKVYGLKNQLLRALKHDNLIVYDRLFDTAEEEFDYMRKRSDHYFELVEGVLNNNTFNPQIMKLINTYVQQGKSGILKARAMEKDKRHAEAVIVLEKSIHNLSGALKIMGVRP